MEVLVKVNVNIIKANRTWNACSIYIVPLYAYWTLSANSDIMYIPFKREVPVTKQKKCNI